MDWLFDPRTPGALDETRAAVLDHLRRHAPSESTVHEAEGSVDLALATAGPFMAPVWCHLDWAGVRPRLSTHGLDGETLALDSERMRRIPAPQRRLLEEAATDLLDDRFLPVSREAEQDLDPELGVLAALDVDVHRDGAAAATVALAAAFEAHPVASPEQVAAITGALLADLSVADRSPTSLHEAVERFAETHAALGGAMTVVSISDTEAEIAIDRSPFGAAVQKAPSLCRLTLAMAGRLAARVKGDARVVLDEAIAYGDPACRLRLFLGPTAPSLGPSSEETAPVLGTSYRWPPAGTMPSTPDDNAPRMELAVSLPRESHSVPVVRRLSAQALRAFGVTDDDIGDVELAITEACANVVEHAVDSDSYEVNIELAADRCAITVIDRGAGFDATRLGDQDDTDAEGGRGLGLMRALVDNLDFTNEPQVGAVVHMVKALRYDAEHPLHAAGFTP